ncbi:MAG: hypothetical protein ACFCD0_22615 [Gemmataceae bacterium]
MNPLQARLSTVRRKFKLVTLIRGSSVLLLVLLGALVLAGVLDWFVHLPALVRALLLVCSFGGALVAGFYFLEPLTRPTDDLALALKVEEQYPILNDSLASTIQFLNQPEDAAGAGSPSLRREAVQRSLRLSQSCDFGAIVDTRGYIWTGFTALGLMLLIGLMTLLHPATIGAGALRLLHPFGDHEWPRQTYLEIDFPKKIATGQAFIIKGKLRGSKIPRTVTIHFRGLQNVEQERDVKVDHNEDEGIATFKTSVSMENQVKEFDFYVVANDDRSPREEDQWHKVWVGPPPRLVYLDGEPSPQLTIHHPKYTGKPTPAPQQPSQGRVEGVPGSWVDFRAATNRPIKRAWVSFKPGEEQERGIEIAAVAGWSNIPSNPLVAMTILGGLRAAHQEIDGTIEGETPEGGSQFSIQFHPWFGGSYYLNIEDHDGLRAKEDYTLKIEGDPKPRIQIVHPSRNRTLPPNGSLSMTLLADDRNFGVRTVYLEYKRKDKDDNYIDQVPKKVTLYLGKDTPGEKEVKIEHRWSIEGLAKEHQTLVVQACAEDFNDVVSFPGVGRSKRIIQIRIATQDEINGEIDRRQRELFEELKQVADTQREVRDNVEKIQKDTQKDKKVKDKQVQKFVEQEQAQKAIEERVGMDKELGIRKKVGELKRLLRDSNKESSTVADRLDIIEQQLDKLANKNLRKLPSDLTALRQKLNDAQRKKQPVDPTTKQEIAKTLREQKEAQEKFEDLLQYLGRWANLQDLRGELRNIKTDQEQLQADTAKLGQKFDKKNPDHQGELRRLAAEQERLAQRLRDSMAKMEKVAEERQKKFEKEQNKKTNAPQEKQDPVAKKLSKAIDIGKKTALPKNLEEIKERLDDQKVNHSEVQQRLALKEFQKMIQALEENPVEEISRKLSKTNKAQDDIEDLTKRLNKVTKKVDDKTKDIREKNKKLQQEQDELSKKLTKLKKLNNPEERKKLEDQNKRLAEQKKRLEQQRKEVQKQVEELKKLQKPENRKKLLDKIQKEQKKLEDEKKKAKEKVDELNKKLEKAKKVDDPMKRKRQVEKLEDLKNKAEKEQKKLEDDVDQLNKKLDKAKDLEKPEQRRKQLEKLDDLDQKNEQQQKQLEKKQDQLNKKLGDPQKRKDEIEDLEKQQKKLEKEVKKLEEERKRVLNELRDEQEKMEKLAKEAREKARKLDFIDGKAGQQLENVAKNAENAAEKMKKGEDPNEDQKKAKEELEKAKKELEKAQEAARRKLAREQLLKVGTQIEGLKARQDGLLADTKRLHRDVMPPKGVGWKRPLQESLEGLKEPQKALGKETKELAGKLPNAAKVFQFILEKAGGNMTKAGELIAKRSINVTNKLIEARAKRLDDPRYPDPKIAQQVEFEQEAHERIVRYQERASARLQRLLDAVKKQVADMKKEDEQKKKQQDKKQDQKDQKKEKKGLVARDGIPPTAQIKALRLEVEDILERTKEFHEANPDPAKFTDDDRAEIEELSADGQAAFRMFREMVPETQMGGPQPEQ